MSKSSVKFVGNARRTFVLPSIFAFALTNDVEMESKAAGQLLKAQKPLFPQENGLLAQP